MAIREQSESNQRHSESTPRQSESNPRHSEAINGPPRTGIQMHELKAHVLEHEPSKHDEVYNQGRWDARSARARQRRRALAQRRRGEQVPNKGTCAHGIQEHLEVDDVAHQARVEGATEEKVRRGAAGG